MTDGSRRFPAQIYAPGPACGQCPFHGAWRLGSGVAVAGWEENGGNNGFKNGTIME